jgi:hypothetical protein
MTAYAVTSTFLKSTDLMADFAADAFTLWFTCNQDRKTDGAYWASSEVPVEEIEKLYNWALRQEPTTNEKGQTCVPLRANLRPRTSKAGNDYLLLAVSDQKPKVESTNAMPF